MILSGWGRYPAVQCRTLALRDRSDITKVFEHCPELIARGNGRAYGDAAINPEMTLLMNACDRFLEFDTRTGIVECEAGTLLSDLLEVVVPRRWFPPVVPGTKFVTIGGLIAADVHGKNHHLDGSFGRHVESLRLAMADGAVVNCSRSENSEIFAATLGGMGLTGVILSARIRLRPVSSGMIEEKIIRVPSLDELLQLLNDRHSTKYSVAWIDCLARGRNFGRAILMLGEHADAERIHGTGKDQSLRLKGRATISVPVAPPFSPLNKWSIKLFNEFYYRFQRPRSGLTHYDRFFFPLDAVLNWNRIYGRRGFVQYQCVVGGIEAERGLRRILSLVPEIGPGAFLAVLKKLGPGNRFLSFPMEGYTITLDFPVRRETIGNLAKLDAVLAEHGGRVYLAKDARAPRNVIEQGYPEIDAFRELRRTIDPNRKIRSVLSERLDL
jgi:decaprenylphospho-beta-D-ribofuranose 2-oxidase